MKTRRTLNRYSYGYDLLCMLNFSGTMLLLAFYNPSVEGASAVFSLACLNLASILIIKFDEIVFDIKREQEGAKYGNTI